MSNKKGADVNGGLSNVLSRRGAQGLSSESLCTTLPPLLYNTSLMEVRAVERGTS